VGKNIKNVVDKNKKQTKCGHKTLVARWLFKPRFWHQGLLYFDSEVAPNSPTILYRHPFVCNARGRNSKHKNIEKIDDGKYNNSEKPDKKV